MIHGISLVSQHDSEEKFKGPLHLEVTFFMPIPHTSSRKKVTNLLGAYHHKKPDLDNLIKYICDISNGILFDDDATISSVFAKKLYADTSRTEFTLMEYNNGK